MTFSRLHLVRHVVSGFSRTGVLAIVLVATALVSAQSPAGGRDTTAASVASFALSQQMPVDPEVVVGTLPNGLRYYVRAERQARPPRRAAAGRQGRLGARGRRPAAGWRTSSSTCSSRARGTSRGKGINDFLASLGLSIGADANAATSYDDTQYTLRVPTDVARRARPRAARPGGLGAAPPRFDQERHRAPARHRAVGVAACTSAPASARADKIRRVQLEGSRYADRPPIGNPDVIEKAHARAARCASIATGTAPT